MNQTKIKGDCQSGRKSVPHNSNSDLTLASSLETRRREKKSFVVIVVKGPGMDKEIVENTSTAEQAFAVRSTVRSVFLDETFHLSPWLLLAAGILSLLTHSPASFVAWDRLAQQLYPR